jgi:hypothetical protein
MLLEIGHYEDMKCVDIDVNLIEMQAIVLN